LFFIGKRNINETVVIPVALRYFPRIPTLPFINFLPSRIHPAEFQHCYSASRKDDKLKIIGLLQNKNAYQITAKALKTAFEPCKASLQKINLVK